MAINRKGRAWILDWYEGTHRKRRWFTTENDARRALRNIQDRRARRPPKNPTPNKGLAALAREYLATKASLSAGHCYNLRGIVTRLTNTAPPNISPTRLQAHHLEPFRLSLRDHKPNTRRHVETHARAFLRWCCRNGNILTPLDELFPPARARAEARTTTASPKSLQKILAAAPPQCRPTVHLLLMLATHAGLRISEVCRARAADWNPRDKLLTIRSAKNHPTRINPTDPELSAYLNTLISPGTPAQAPLTQLASPRHAAIRPDILRRHWNHARLRAGETNINPHDLRRTWATEHAEHAPLPVLMELAGWESAKTALTYIQLAGSIDAKRRAVARAWNANHPEPLEIREIPDKPPPPKPNRKAKRWN
jgi:integrase